MIDTFRHKGMRKHLIKVLRLKGIKSEAVLAAIEKIPRHLFLDKAFEEHAYEDKAFRIGAGQTISHPYTVAKQSELLEIKRNDKILEVGTGSGYQSCVLAELGARVYSIERQKSLYETSKPLIEELRYNIKTFYGDGYLGLPSYAPFDKVIVTAGAPFIPPALIEQLKVGGILVIPVGNEDDKVMKTIRKISATETETTEHGLFRFVPLLEDKAGK
jgi:protein-L-isoaspartate(D-aspartate) O-methyltransferase